MSAKEQVMILILDFCPFTFLDYKNIQVLEMTSHNKASFSPKSDHYPQFYKFLKMEGFTKKISEIVMEKNHIQTSNFDKIIKDSITFGLEKKRRNLDRKLNRTKMFKPIFSQVDDNKLKWEQFRVCIDQFKSPLFINSSPKNMKRLYYGTFYFQM